MTVRLYAFTCGWWKADPSFFMAGAHGEKIRSPVPAFLIEHPKGLAVFDTGLAERFRKPGPARDMAVKAAEIEFCDADDIGAQVAVVGHEPANVKWIINSHLHLDHCGGNASLRNATAIIQRSEIDYARANADGELYVPEEFDTGQPYLLIDGKHDLFGDGSVMIIPTVGHTPGHQSARIRLPKGEVVLAADCCYLKRSLDEMRLPAVNWDQEKAMDTLRALRSMRNSGARLFYGHDASSWSQVPQRTVLE